ncbi:MAG: DUF2332 domain-containing protein [Pseudomonadota bacterium]
MTESWIGGPTADRYRRFVHEVERTSPSYAALCSWIAESPASLAFLDALPEPKRQPNLFLAALRKVAGVPGSRAALEDTLASQGPAIAAVMRRRATQTNEPGRCAVLLPLLAALAEPGRPLALLEVGASAGLCLLPDRYAYAYGDHRMPGPPGAPEMTCTVTGPAPLPAGVPSIAWRAGLDLNPLSAADPDDRDWLKMLVWPEEATRAARLDAALDLAAAAPPRVVTGRLETDLADLAATAPPDARLVIYHTAVLAYLPPEGRAQFVETVQALDAAWIACEAPSVLPEIAAKAPAPPDWPHFLLSLDGVPRAWASPHGQRLAWFA